MVSEIFKRASSSKGKMRVRVDIGDRRSANFRSLMVITERSDTVSKLASTLQQRENKRRRLLGHREVLPPELQMEVDGAKCEVDPDEVMNDVFECASGGESQKGPTFFAVFSERQHDPPGASTASPVQGTPTQRTPAQGTPVQSTPEQGTPAQSTPVAAPSAPPQTTPQQGSFWTTAAISCPDVAFIGHRQSSSSQPASASEEAEFLPTVQVQHQGPPPILQGALPMPTAVASSPGQLAPVSGPAQAVPPAQSTPVQAAPLEPTRPAAPQVIFPTHQLFVGPQAVATGEPRWSAGTQLPANRQVAKQSEERRVTVHLPTKKRVVVVQPKKKRVVPPSTAAGNVSTLQATTQLKGQPPNNGNVNGDACADTDETLDDVPEQGEGVLSHSLFQWQAAENLVVNAIMLRTTSQAALAPRLKAVRFFTDIARAAGEDPEMVLDGAQIVVEDESSSNPTEPHRLVMPRPALAKLCKTEDNPIGFDCISRYLNGRHKEKGGQDAISFQGCFGTLARKSQRFDNDRSLLFVKHGSRVAFRLRTTNPAFMVGASRQESLPENLGTVEEASRSEANGSSTETYASTKNGTPAKEVESVDDGETSESEESIGNVSPLEESVRLPNSRRGRRTGERAERLRQSRADNRERRAAVEPILAKVILLRTTSDAARKPREAAESFFASLAQETGEDSAALIVGLRETVGIRRSTQRNVCKFVLPLESVLKLFKTEDNTNGFECLTRRVPGQDKPAPASPRSPLISVDQLRRSFRAALNDSVKPTGARRIKRLQLINGEVGFALADQNPAFAPEMNTRNTSLVAAGGQEGSRDQREQSGPDVRQKSPGSPAGVVSSNPEQSASTCPVASPVSGPQKQQENVEEETEGGEATVVGPEPAGDTSPAHQKAVRATYVLAGSEISTRIRSRMKTEAESKTDHELGHELPQEANAAGVPNPSVVVKQSPASPKLPRGDDDAAADSKELAAASVAHAPDGQPPVEMPGKAATSEGKGTENKRNQQVGAASTDASSEAQANTAQAAKGNATDDLKRKGQERDGEGRHKSSVGKRMKSEVRR